MVRNVITQERNMNFPWNEQIFDCAAEVTFSGSNLPFVKENKCTDDTFIFMTRLLGGLDVIILWKLFYLKQNELQKELQNKHSSIFLHKYYSYLVLLRLPSPTFFRWQKLLTKQKTQNSLRNHWIGWENPSKNLVSGLSKLLCLAETPTL